MYSIHTYIIRGSVFENCFKITFNLNCLLRRSDIYSHYSPKHGQNSMLANHKKGSKCIKRTWFFSDTHYVTIDVQNVPYINHPTTNNVFIRLA